MASAGTSVVIYQLVPTLSMHAGSQLYTICGLTGAGMTSDKVGLHRLHALVGKRNVMLSN